MGACLQARVFNQRFLSTSTIKVIIEFPKGFILFDTKRYPVILAFHGDSPIPEDFFNSNHKKECDLAQDNYPAFIIYIIAPYKKDNGSPFGIFKSWAPGTDLLSYTAISANNSIISKAITNMLDESTNFWGFNNRFNDTVHAIGHSGGTGFMSWVHSVQPLTVNPLRGKIKSYVMADGVTYVQFSDDIIINENQKKPTLLVFGNGGVANDIYGWTALVHRWRGVVGDMIAANKKYSQYLKRYCGFTPPLYRIGRNPGTYSVPGYEKTYFENLDNNDARTRTRMIRHVNTPNLYMLHVNQMDHSWPDTHYIGSFYAPPKNTKDFNMWSVAFQFFQTSQINYNTTSGPSYVK